MNHFTYLCKADVRDPSAVCILTVGITSIVIMQIKIWRIGRWERRVVRWNFWHWKENGWLCDDKQEWKEKVGWFSPSSHWVFYIHGADQCHGKLLSNLPLPWPEDSKMQNSYRWLLTKISRIYRKMSVLHQWPNGIGRSQLRVQLFHTTEFGSLPSSHFGVLSYQIRAA